MPVRCQGCGHTAHPGGRCRHRGPPGCIPVIDAAGRMRGLSCGTGAPCPCAWRDCACGRPIAVAVTQIGQEMSVERGSAGAAEGTLAVRKMANGRLGCRVLTPGDRPGAGEWRGLAHAGRCAIMTLDDTDADAAKGTGSCG